MQHWQVNPPLALKKLHRRQGHNLKDFRQETSILVKLGEIDQPHIIHLITAFRHGEQYYLVFPLAEYSLMRHFETKEPERSIEHVHWLLKQATKITHALYIIHDKMEGSSKNSLLPTYRHGRQQQQPQEPGFLGVPTAETAVSLRDSNVGKTGEELKGYHHDLALNNLLLFYRLHEELQGLEARWGRIVISDFGLSKLRRPTDGSKTLNVRGQLNYMPPESNKSGPGETSYQDRKKDIWSLGCILLQMLVWLEGGSESLGNFERERQV
jgi:serine/threonine protein kinase